MAFSLDSSSADLVSFDIQRDRTIETVYHYRQATGGGHTTLSCIYIYIYMLTC